MTETEARRLLRHGSTDTTRSGWATASIQVLSGGARAGAAIHTLTTPQTEEYGASSGVDMPSFSPTASPRATREAERGTPPP